MAADVATIYLLIQDSVRRPDRQAVIWRKIHEAILAAHRIDQWKQDLVEQIYQFDIANNAAANQVIQPGINGQFMNWFGNPLQSTNVQQINLLAFPRFRKVNYLRKFANTTNWGAAIYDPTNGQIGTVQGGDLTERNPDSLYDGYGFDVQNTYYRSGDVININSSTPLNSVYFGWFRDPIVNLGCNDAAAFANCESWVADKYPSLISTMVITQMYGILGKPSDEIKMAVANYTTQFNTITGNETRAGTK